MQSSEGLTAAEGLDSKLLCVAVGRRPQVLIPWASPKSSLRVLYNANWLPSKQQFKRENKEEATCL